MPDAPAAARVPRMATRSKFFRGSRETVEFRFSSITLDNVPFCHKTLSLRIQVRLTTHETDPTPVENFVVRWTKPIQFQRALSRDSSGKLVPSVVDVEVASYNVTGTNNRQQVANGKIDLAQLTRNRRDTVSIPLQSKLLGSTLRFDCEIKGGDCFIESANEAKPGEMPRLPAIGPVSRNSWFHFKHNPDQIDADANLLVEAASRPITAGT
jgi:hypothetical protein